MPKFQLVLLIHAHQPVGNFEDVLARAYEQSYLPFIQVLEHHPSIHVGLHYSGCLLEWIERARPEYFNRLGELAGRGQVEIVGGGFYEPIMIAIPQEDRLAQITRLADYIEKHFGARPRGAWLAERVWEPQLPSTLARAQVEYTLVDDNHFLEAGFELDQLFGCFMAEDEGKTVKVLPGLKALRYLVPFHEPAEIAQFLRHAAAEHRDGFATMGDDLEKFGIWPGTYKLCYTDGWLERFFSELEKNSDWLETTTPAGAIDAHAPLGRADLPAASYAEMMEWALPTPARSRFHVLCEEFATRPETLPFLRGATWRNFFTKYSESNLLQKKMLHVSGKVRKTAGTPRREKTARAAHSEAETLLLRSQCNDAYWHGIFGGLYSPHLRTALWNSLIRAEAAADSLAHRGKSFTDSMRTDFIADGNEELYFTSDRYAALVQPEDGATISALDCRTTGTALINSLTRRREAYHDRLKNAPSKIVSSVQSIHDQVRVKEEGLERWLNYDRWPRHAFRVLLFGREKNYQDYAAVRLDEDPGVAAGRFRVVDTSKNHAALVSAESPDWPAEKLFEFSPAAGGFTVSCEATIRRTALGSASVLAGIEAIVNFLAPTAPDRYFESAGQRFPLRWAATVPAKELRVVDEWQRVAVTIVAPGAREFWVAPIETVSESEEGFERIYQGSQILAVWPVELAPGGEWEGRLEMHVAGLSEK